MHASVEHLQITAASSSQIADVQSARIYLVHQVSEVGEVLCIHSVRVVDILMAKGWQRSIVHHALDSKPPLTKQRGYEWSDQASDVYEYVENLESGIPFALSDSKLLWTFLRSLCLQVVIHLPDDCLQITLEQAISESNECQSQASECQKP